MCGGGRGRRGGGGGGGGGSASPLPPPPVLPRQLPFSSQPMCPCRPLGANLVEPRARWVAGGHESAVHVADWVQGLLFRLRQLSFKYMVRIERQPYVSGLGSGEHGDSER